MFLRSSLQAAALLLGSSIFPLPPVYASPSCSSPSTRCASLAHVASSIGISGDLTYNTTHVAAGTLELPNVKGSNNASICRVQASIAYGAEKNNTLLFELWLPDTDHYNQRYLSVGNGGFAGTIDYTSMLANLNTGYAVGGCDSGHKTSQNGPTKPGGYVDFMHNVDETRAWIQNSIAMFTEPAKKLTTAYYHNRPPKKMYYAGCSTGGAQGFALAQYHPHIFDGIYAGSPGNWYSHLILSFLWNGLNANSSAEAFIPQNGLDLIKSAALEQCDALDGVTDGLIENPSKCDFDVASLTCKPNQSPISSDNSTTCLTPAQIKTAQLIYQGPKNTATGANVYPGFAPGSEAEWLVQEQDLWIQYGIPILQNLVFMDLSYDYRTFNWGSDVDKVDSTASPLIDETSPDLREYLQHQGGKMLVTQGWADPYNAPTWPIDQREEMKKVFGGEEVLDKLFRLFMVPGGGHCGSATSYPQMPGTWHGLDALVAWVEGGEDKAPEAVLATGPADGSNTTRRLCPWPKEAVLKAGGDRNNWESYECK